jgi:hypothetical protein
MRNHFEATRSQEVERITQKAYYTKGNQSVYSRNHLMSAYNQTPPPPPPAPPSIYERGHLQERQVTSYVIGWIWPSGITLDCVMGREGSTVLARSSSYSHLGNPTDISHKEAILSKFTNMVPIGAINDGCLQIQVPDSATGGRMFWSRQYYVIPLEVSYASLSPVPVFLCPFSMFQTDGIVGNRHSRYSSAHLFPAISRHLPQVI